MILEPNPLKVSTLIGPEKVGTTGSNPLTPDPDCPRATGVISGRSVSPVVLGSTRAAQRRTLTHYWPMANSSFDDVCLASGHGIRVGYLNGRAVLAMTANTLYAEDGVSPGTSVGKALGDLGPKVGRGITRGRYTWYSLPLRRATLFIEVKAGTVVNIGLGSASLTRTLAARQKLLNELRA